MSGPDPGEQIGHGLCDGRERSASGYQPGTTVGVEDVEPGDTSAGRSPGQCRQNGTQSPVVAVEVVRRVSIGVGLDVDSQIAAAGIDGKRQIVDRSGAQDVAAARAVPQRGLARNIMMLTTGLKKPRSATAPSDCRVMSSNRNR